MRKGEHPDRKPKQLQPWPAGMRFEDDPREAARRSIFARMPDPPLTHSPTGCGIYFGTDPSVAAKPGGTAEARLRAMAPIVSQVRAAGLSTLQAIATELNRLGVPTLSGRGRWAPRAVARVLGR